MKDRATTHGFCFMILHMSDLSLTFIMGMAQGVCFTVLHKSKAGLGVDCVRGHGFCVARRPLKMVTPRKTFMHWASVDTFRPGLSVLDAGLPRKDSAEDKEERQEWTAPCYFDISIMGCGDSFGAFLGSLISHLSCCDAKMLLLKDSAEGKREALGLDCALLLLSIKGSEDSFGVLHSLLCIRS